MSPVNVMAVDMMIIIQSEFTALSIPRCASFLVAAILIFAFFQLTLHD
jgi:hypothetical protein